MGNLQAIGRGRGHASATGKARILQEFPRPGDVQDIDIADEIVRERRERRGELDDPDRRVIKHLMAGAAANSDFPDAAVRVDRDIE